MKALPPIVQAAIGALIVGFGLSVMLRAAQSARPCEDCEEDALASIDDVAGASAEMQEGGE